MAQTKVAPVSAPTLPGPVHGISNLEEAEAMSVQYRHRVRFTTQNTVPRPAPGFFRALPFAIVLDIAIVGIVVGMCYLVSFLMHNPAWFVAFVCGCVLAILVGFRAEGKS
jgi:hypothetical protein